MLRLSKGWLRRRPWLFYLAGGLSFRKHVLQMAWLGVNARMVKYGLPSFSRHIIGKAKKVFLKSHDEMLIVYDFDRPDGGLHPMFIYKFDYECEVLDVIRQHFKPCSLFIDIGANIGMHSIRSLQAGNPQERAVLAIEADSKTFSILALNIEANGCTAFVDTVKAVLWSESMPLHWKGSHSEHGHNHASASVTLPGRTVLGTNLDSVLMAYGDQRPISIVKIDVEGAELEVLKGAKETLIRNMPALIVEIEDEYLVRNGASSDTLKNYLYSLGYQHGQPIGNAAFGIQNNYIFVKEANVLNG